MLGHLHMIGQVLCNDHINGPCLYIEPEHREYMLRGETIVVKGSVLDNKRIVTGFVFLFSILSFGFLLWYLIRDRLLVLAFAPGKHNQTTSAPEDDMESGLVSWSASDAALQILAGQSWEFQSSIESAVQAGHTD